MPTFSSNYQIKLIGTGEEAGTWGTSTNENLKRIEQVLGTASQIDITSPPSGSSWSAPTLTFQTSDTVDAYADGSEGRSAFLSFHGNPSGNANVQFRGNGSSDLVDRVYIIQNNLDSTYTLTLNNNSSLSTNTITIQNGCYAVVGLFTGSTVSGGLTNNSVSNLLSKLQIDDILFPAAADITLANSLTSALEIKSTASNSEFLRFDTDNNHLEVAPGSGINTVEVQAATVDASSQNTSISIRDGQADSFEILEGTNSYLKFNTSTQTVHIGEESSDVETLDISTDTIRVADQATDIRINAGSTTALTVSDSTGTILTVDTGTEPEKIITAATTELEVLGTLDVDGTSDFSATATFSSVDINGGTIDGTNVGAASAGTGKFSALESTGTTNGVHLSSADSYASFGATAGSGGHGVRDNSGVLEVRNTNSDAWGQPYHVGMVHGQGAYFKSAANLALGTGNLAINVASQEAHSLGSVPRIIQARLVCTDTDNGYAAGDEVFPPTFELNNRGFTFGCNTSYVFFNTGSTSLIYLPPKTGGGQVALTLSKWDLFLHAWA